MSPTPETYTSANLNLDSTPAFTDLSRWRLRVEEGAQTWHYLATDEECEDWPQKVSDKYHLGLPTVRRLFTLNVTFLIYECIG